MNDFLQQALQKRISEGSFRKLSIRKNLIDFCSNDYLGLSRSASLRPFLQPNTPPLSQRNGSTGSRLISGNSEEAENLETFLADFHQAEAALLFNSGYDANLGLFSSLPGRNDTVIYDESIHASVKDGIRLSPAQKVAFRHNDTVHLEEKLKSAKGNVFVAIEAVYSMDGDQAPMREIADMCQKYTAHLIVDEAHSNGIFGIDGKGLTIEAGIKEKTFAVVYTFGKALGCHGAAVCGSQLLKDFLINFARSFIYTTAMPLHSIQNIYSAYTYLPFAIKEREKLFHNIGIFKKSIFNQIPIQNTSQTPIQFVSCHGNQEALKLSKKLQEAGFDVRPILSPTVPLGKERIRICLHAFNEEEQIQSMIEEIIKFRNE